MGWFTFCRLGWIEDSNFWDKNWTFFAKCFPYHKVFRTQLLPFFCLWIFGWYVIRIDLELTLCIYAVNCWLFWLMLHVIFLTKSVRKVCVAWRPKKCNNVVVIMISFFIFFPTTSSSLAKWFFKTIHRMFFLPVQKRFTI